MTIIATSIVDGHVFEIEAPVHSCECCDRAPVIGRDVLCQHCQHALGLAQLTLQEVR